MNNQPYRVLSALLLAMSVALIPGCQNASGPLNPMVATNSDSNRAEAEAPEEVPQVFRVTAQQIPGEYIVVLKSNVASAADAAADLARQHGLAHHLTYQSTIKGFSAGMSAQAAAQVAKDPRVNYVEADSMAFALAKNPGSTSSSQPAQVTTWGVTRVGGPADGTGKTAWIIDTGIDLTHPDLNVDTAHSKNFVPIGANSPKDGNGHGTHVAGIIGAKNNTIGVVGVAANASVVAVRVLDNRGSGQYSWVIAGVDYVAANAKAGDAANMSLGGPASQALDDAVAAAASKGIKFALAAGNNGAFAGDYSPARANGANIYTISAIDSNNVFASWSNWGNPPVDFAAPGVSIFSTYKGGGYATMSGTSMAAPHMAGILLMGTLSQGGFAISDPDGNPDVIAHL